MGMELRRMALRSTFDVQQTFWAGKREGLETLSSIYSLDLRRCGGCWENSSSRACRNDVLVIYRGGWTYIVKGYTWLQPFGAFRFGGYWKIGLLLHQQWSLHQTYVYRSSRYRKSPSLTNESYFSRACTTYRTSCFIPHPHRRCSFIMYSQRPSSPLDHTCLQT